MSELKKLDRWAEKLLDTGKRNNLINFRDTKNTTAKVLYPDTEGIFSKCAVGRVFDVFDPKIREADTDDDGDAGAADLDRSLSQEEYFSRYSSKIKNEKTLLMYARTPNPITAVKTIAKKAKELQDETGINVAYLAFGFVKWTEKEGSEVVYRAPLLLVHVNVITGSIVDPVRIEISDDDVVINPTFNYLLQADYGITLPELEDGETLTEYLSHIQQMVRSLKWDVLNECALGIFSFLKINMYEDLKQNASQVLENKNVKALLGEDPDNQFVQTGEDEAHAVKNPLIDLHTVVDADSSQMEAIMMAKSGKSFVLQGPPGTGKSQTITNIIAECLHDGKKVLFVSEKQAALNVVYDKLKKANLSDYCLELHSHKANKRALIDELNRTLELPRTEVDASATDEIRQKQEAQSKLDGYAAALHEVRKPIEQSLFQLFEAYSSQKRFPDLHFSIQNIQEKGKDYFDHTTHLLEQYVDYVPSVGINYRQYAWYGFSDETVSFDERLQLKSDLEQVLQGFQTLQKTTEMIKTKYEMPELSFQDTRRWRSVLSISAQSDVVAPAFLSGDAYHYAMPRLMQLKELSETIVQIRDEISEAYEPTVLTEVNGQELYSKLTGSFKSWFTRLFSGKYKKLITELRTYAKSGKKVSYKRAVNLTDRLAKLQSARNAIPAQEAELNAFLGPWYDGENTDWTHVSKELSALDGFFTEKTPAFGALSKMAPAAFAEKRTAFKADSEQLSRQLDAIEDVKNCVAKHFDPEILNLEKNSYDTCLAKLRACLSEFDKLGNWVNFLSLHRQMDEAGLMPYLDTAIDNRLPSEAILGTYRRGFYKQWIEYILFSDPALASFTRIKQDQAVQLFAMKDKLQYKISKAQIRSELSLRKPNTDIVAGGSPVAILRREAQKKRKQMPIRRLLSEVGALAQILKPCFMMSPLSVSTFLDPEKIHFDTVVFDEASQVFPQDAIGAIYRGNQLIVVGDSRQMPPSNFFNASTDIELDDEDGDVNDFESILDVCSAVFTTERLAWHYRSHYEQLIAFSNLHFYNNQLVTFPSSENDHMGIGVDYYHVDGVFDRKSKTNRVEAQFIVDLVFQNIKTYPDRSLGVVAFSASQQNLIDKLISKKREEDHSYEWFFKADSAEPFFVKNLETVQGDERNTIIFSVAYAKDSQGRFIQNFGPVNRVGGERRLNVAFTRAKDNVQLVASIRYSDINLSNSGSEGVRLLRAYLDYAENGEQALERAVTVSNSDRFDSYFEQEVCDFLRDHGYEVDTQIGCSGYRIDLGLRKPDSSNYLMAIECDGASYHSSKNARDRDCLRQRVLENMGWKFYRIWSTDWYRNQAVEKERLLQAVKDAITNSDASDNAPGNRLADKADFVEPDKEMNYITELPEESIEFKQYRQVDAMSLIQANGGSLHRAILAILQTEAPLSEEYLLKRIVPFFHREKVTSVVLEEYNRLMHGCERMGIVRKEGFLFLRGMDHIELRVPGDRRDIKYIPIEELAAGMQIMIEQNVSVNREGLFKKLANLLGFSRTGGAITDRFEKTIDFLKTQNLIEEKDGFFSMNG